MIAWLEGLTVVQLAIAIFFLRIVDVSVGTMRTIMVVQGRTFVAAGLGFVEVLVWITVVSQVIDRAGENPLLLLTYACGFASGNAIGIWLERWLAQGTVTLRIVTSECGDAIQVMLADHSSHVFAFEGKNASASTTMVYAVIPRNQIRNVIALAKEIDANLFYSVDPLRQSSDLAKRPPAPTLWRGMTKSK